VKQHKAFMYNGALTLIICESGATFYFESSQMLLCKTAPNRNKDFTILRLNKMCKEGIRSACRFRIVGVSPELGILLSCACAAAAGT
jgi:hypothetical protein